MSERGVVLSASKQRSLVAVLSLAALTAVPLTSRCHEEDANNHYRPYSETIEQEDTGKNALLEEIHNRITLRPNQLLLSHGNFGVRVGDPLQAMKRDVRSGLPRALAADRRSRTLVRITLRSANDGRASERYQKAEKEIEKDGRRTPNSITPPHTLGHCEVIEYECTTRPKAFRMPTNTGTSGGKEGGSYHGAYLPAGVSLRETAEAQQENSSSVEKNVKIFLDIKGTGVDIHISKADAGSRNQQGASLDSFISEQTQAIQRSLDAIIISHDHTPTPREHLRLGQDLLASSHSAESMSDESDARGALISALHHFGCAYTQAALLTESEWRSAVNHYGVLLSSAGRLEEAREVFENACERDPSHPSFRYSLACVLAEQGQKAGMLRELESAYRLRSALPQGDQVHIADPSKDLAFKDHWSDPALTSLVEMFSKVEMC